MLRRLAVPLLAAGVAATVLAPSAVHATHVHGVAGVDSCSATAPPNEVRAYCVFVATGRTYHLTISGWARYAFARVTCAGPSGGYLFVGKWDTEGYSKTKPGPLPHALCTLEVASDGDYSDGIVS